MKALLNLDAGAAFDIESPSIGNIFIENLADLQPEAVYALALQNLPQNKVIDLRLMSAKKDVDVAKGHNVSIDNSIWRNWYQLCKCKKASIRCWPG